MTVDTEAAKSKKKPRSKCVACLCSPITIVVTVLILIGLALTLYFLWPRNPDIYVSIPPDRLFVEGVDLKTNSSNTVQGLLQASETNPFTLVLNLTALVTAFSHNYIDVYANKINVLVNILDDSGKELPGVSGESVLSGINFSKKANTSVNAVRSTLLYRGVQNTDTLNITGHSSLLPSLETRYIHRRRPRPAIYLLEMFEDSIQNHSPCFRSPRFTTPRLGTNIP
jgi:hypothetical protein